MGIIIRNSKKALIRHV